MSSEPPRPRLALLQPSRNLPPRRCRPALLHLSVSLSLCRGAEVRVAVSAVSAHNPTSHTRWSTRLSTPRS